MRISDRYQQQQALRAVRAQVEQLARAQDEAITGRRVRTLSDAPADATIIMRVSGTLRDIDQYRRTGTEVTTRLSAEDAVLTSTTKLLDQVRQIALAGTGQTGDAGLRRAAIDEVSRIFDQLVSLGNTQVGNEYIFGGSQTGTPPFLADGSYAGDANLRQAEIDSGLVVEVGHAGDDVFGASLAAVQDLLQELQSGVPSSPGATVALNAAKQGVLGVQGESASRIAQVRDTSEYLGRRAAILLDQREALRDADPAESLLRVTVLQSAMERAYAVLGKVMSTHLTDFLR